MDLNADLHSKLASLETRIAAKKLELETQGVLHGPEREAAAEMEMQHARLRAKLTSAMGGNPSLANELSGDVEVLKNLFEQWVARTDRRSEKR